MMTKSLQIHPQDNVAVALVGLVKGNEMTVGKDRITLLDDVPAKHKYAMRDIDTDADVIMYGVLVGKATQPIKKGALLSTSNIRHASGEYRVSQRKTDWIRPDVSRWHERTFMGYHRSNGAVGVKNYWLLIPLVFCENKNVSLIHETLVKELGYQRASSPYAGLVRELKRLYQAGGTDEATLATAIDTETIGTGDRLFAHVDGIKMLTHTLGCGGTKDDARTLCGLLAGYVTHPNVAGATVLSLGCQNAQISLLEAEIAKRDASFNKPLYILEQQRIGNEADLLREAVQQTFMGLVQANEVVRQPTPLSKLCIGLECGGSDGFSGISANPALGYTADVLVALGASVVLSEFPELCGVEQELSDRCVDEELAGKFVHLMQAYQHRAEAVGSGFDSNPSAGNIRDGLITDAIKSAGAAKKGGTSPVVDVLDYPDKVTKPGLTLLCTPGSDIESTTAEVGSGATVVVFTTGLGTPTGNPIAPVVKVATNTPLYEKMNDIIDLDAGTVVRGEEGIEAAGERILEHIIRVASGEEIVKAEVGGHDDFIPWKRGISL
ncbi:UxaA family hydrolase [Parapedobacter koreensis]|uniref:Altronate hydrolase n=1 Tax=Parapedobacter koreensis TaxID=332977 RepID=A0A1H7TI24_9SPHI|nr:altronate dehydratase family protein [Parapedobacter koreensis]SEL84338.1 altronate hydrolase [Parapedobacter koreensis]